MSIKDAEKEAIEQLPMGDGWSYRCDREKLRKKCSRDFEQYYRHYQELHKCCTLDTYSQCRAEAAPTPKGVEAVSSHSDEVNESEDLWSAFMDSVGEPLPMTFWINDSDPMGPTASAYFMKLHEQQSDKNVKVSPIPWYPIKNMGWRIDIDKKKFRKDPACVNLRRYLIQQTAMGTLNRQEEVSMIPVFLLEIQPTDRCLDMCASPGSKTGQMLAALGRKKIIPNAQMNGNDFDYFTEGCVVANELDAKRANMLVYQIKRLRALFPFALFINHDARYLPELPESLFSSGTRCGYDKILCDVVCTGDGTLRKAPHLMQRWHPNAALNIQLTQIQIAFRGLQLLRVGGRMVYSTCSLNPIENEAVVAELLRASRGAVRVVNTKGMLPCLLHSEGWTSWAVTNAKGKLLQTKEGVAGETQQNFGADIPKSCFPPSAEENHITEELKQCLRFLPAHCNGGGFFIALLEKISPLPCTEFYKPPTEQKCPGGKEVSSKRQRHEDKTDGHDDQKNEHRREDKLQDRGFLKKSKIGKVPQELTEVEGVENSKKIKGPPPLVFVRTPEEVAISAGEYYGLTGFPWRENVFIRPPTGEIAFRQSLTSSGAFVSNGVRDLMLAYNVVATEQQQQLYLKDNPQPEYKSLLVKQGGKLARPEAGEKKVVEELTKMEKKAKHKQEQENASVAALKATEVVTKYVNPKVVIVAAGLRCLATEQLTGLWRVTHEASALFLSLMGSTNQRVLQVVPEDLLPMVSNPLRQVMFEDMASRPLSEKLQALSVGPLVLKIVTSHAPCGYVSCTALRARTRFQLLVEKEDIGQLMCRIGMAEHPVVTKVMSAEAGDAEV